MSGRVHELESSLAHELHSLAAAGSARISELAAGLQSKMDDIGRLKDAFETQLQGLWGEYAEMHGQMTAVQEVCCCCSCIQDVSVLGNSDADAAGVP